MISTEELEKRIEELVTKYNDKGIIYDAKRRFLEIVGIIEQNDLG